MKFYSSLNFQQMKRLLDMNGVAYKRVSLQSAYIASVSITFQVDLEEDDQSENITQLSMFLGDPEQFSSFSDYNVTEDGRGVVDITVAGIVICIDSMCSNGAGKVYADNFCVTILHCGDH